MKRLVNLTIGVLIAMGMLFTQSIAYADPGTATPNIKVDIDKSAPSGTLPTTEIKSKSAILIDRRTGKVLFEKDAEAKCYPASTTKIMTALLVLEKAKLDDVVTVGNLGTFEKDSTMINLVKGEKITVKDLLYGLMLESGNDAAVALAQHVGQTKAGFADIMNARAQELGMKNTHFVTPNGLHDTDHYTTAKDMALLAIAAMANEDFRTIVSTKEYTAAPTNKTTKARKFENSNRLIMPAAEEAYAYPFAIGIKIGYTSKAKQALVSAATKDDMQLIAVVLNCEEKVDKWTDSMLMFEYGFKFIKTINLSTMIAAQQLQISPPSNADSTVTEIPVTVVPAGDHYFTDKYDVIDALVADPSTLHGELTLADNLQAPINQGDKLGTVTYQVNADTVITADIISAVSVSVAPIPTEKPTPTPVPTSNILPEPTTTDKSILDKLGESWIIILVAAVILIIILILIIRSVVNRRNQAQARRSRPSRPSGSRTYDSRSSSSRSSRGNSHSGGSHRRR